MRRILLLVLCLGLMSPSAALAADSSEALWTRSEGDGSYVTIRVPYAQGDRAFTWPAVQDLSVRYADTKEPVGLTSSCKHSYHNYQKSYFFATVPADEADRPLEVFQGEKHRFPDMYTERNGQSLYTAPEAEQMFIRGVIRGDPAGNLNGNAPITRAEAFTMICRLLDLHPQGDPGYVDVTRGDWYFEASSAVRAAGIAAESQFFFPNRLVVRGEMTTMLARAMETLGWLHVKEGTAADLELADRDEIPLWALGSYLAFADNGVGTGGIGIFTERDTEEIAQDGYPREEISAQWDKAVTRLEAINFLEEALHFLPYYPNETAIQWGFGGEMPVIDGSTSTYPYTKTLYDALFFNGENHPQYPDAHSKSHESYERLINGEVDVLFAATKASSQLEAQAKKAGVTLEYIPIAYDAMVFFTNRENTITGLTQKQIQEIYVENRYDNWRQVGGPDAGLLPYRRNADSGSHALMERYFLEGGKLSLSPDIYNVYTSYAMTTALTDVASALQTDPPAYAIGYSVYYFYLNSYWLLEDVGGDRELKLLEVDGVAPSDATIADGSYPLAGNNYAVIRASEPEDSLARRLVAFMRSQAGQDCVSRAGFGPLSGSAAADFAKQMPDWTLADIFPSYPGYIVLSWNQDQTVQRASYLEWGTDAWKEIAGVSCPIPKDDGLAWAVLGTRNSQLVFGSVNSQLEGAGQVRLTGGDGQTQICDAHTGHAFSFLLDQNTTPESLEILFFEKDPVRYRMEGS